MNDHKECTKKMGGSFPTRDVDKRVRNEVTKLLVERKKVELEVALQY